MSSERWRQVDRLLQRLLDRNPEQRCALLDQYCIGDESLRREVESLLSSYDSAGNFMQTPPTEVAKELLAEQSPGLQIGESLGPYKIAGILGRGGMGEVYSAVDTRLGREVAIKVLPAELASNPQWLQRFEREAHAASAINHPNIVTVHEFGISGLTHYLIMELIRGRTLREVLSAGSLSMDKLLPLAIQMAEGLAKAHSTGITHRDLKPENTMITEDDLVKILDFGLAAYEDLNLDALEPAAAPNHPRAILGTVGYMSPEQAGGGTVGFQSDQFSFGAILYEMATGRRAFQGATAAETVSSVLRHEPMRMDLAKPDVPESFRKIVERCLSKIPGGRYASARDLVCELKTLRALVERPVPAGALPEAPFDSIAVLPFANLSGNPELDYFCDGVADEIQDQLSSIPGLRVAARTSSFQFKGTTDNVRKIGDLLGVRHVLEGTVRRAGRKLRVSVQLVNTKEGYRLWSEKYDVQPDNSLAVQEAIANAVSHRLKADRPEVTQGGLTRRMTASASANHFYLKGRFHWRRTSPDGLRIAIRNFEKAVECDPGFALAWAGIADCNALIGSYCFDHPGRYFPQAKENAQKALNIDESTAEAYSTLILVAVHWDWDFALAGRYFEKAQRLRPYDSGVRQRYGLSLLALGRFGDAILRNREALELDPLSLSHHMSIGYALYLAGRYSEARESFVEALELDPTFAGGHFWLSAILAREGRFDEAIQEAATAASFVGDLPMFLANRARIFGMAGARKEALDLLETLEAMSARIYVPSYHIAAVFLALGQKEQALHLLEMALDERGSFMAYLRHDPEFSTLRDDPRFISILDRIRPRQ